MKKYLNKKNIIISIVLLLLIIIEVYVVYTNRKDNKDNKINNTSITENLETIDYMYNNIKNYGCNSTILDNVMTKDKYLISDMNDDDILNIIFSGLYNNHYLNKEQIEKLDYHKMAIEILGKDFVYPDNINSYSYNGNIYNLNGGYITKKSSTCIDKEYRSYLYGYASDTENLEIYIRVGYVTSNKVYDLKNDYIDEYAKDNIDINLAKATLIVYKYKKEANEYKLLSIEKSIVESE